MQKCQRLLTGAQAHEFLCTDHGKEQQFRTATWGFLLFPAALSCLSAQLGQPRRSARAFVAADEAAQLTLWLPAARSLLPAHPRTRSISCCLWQLLLLPSPCCFSLPGVKGSFQDAPFCFLCNPCISLINSICAGSVMSIWPGAFISTAGCVQHEMLLFGL